jgi:hypothetical protein
MENIGYVTFDRTTRALTGAYLQVPPAEHIDRLEVADGVRENWTMYQMNAALTGVERTQAPLPAPSTVPEEISPRQFRQALNHFSFRQQVDGAVANSADQDLKDWYEFTSAFQRHHPTVLAMATALGFTDAQMDATWTYGSTI